MFRKYNALSIPLEVYYRGFAEAEARIPVPAVQGPVADPLTVLQSCALDTGHLLCLSLNLCAASDKLSHSSRLFHCFEDPAECPKLWLAF